MPKSSFKNSRASKAQKSILKMTINNLRSSKIDSSRENKIISSLIKQTRDSASGPNSKGLRPNKKIFNRQGKNSNLGKKLLRKKTRKQPSDAENNFLKLSRRKLPQKKSLTRVRSLQEENLPQLEESYFNDINPRESELSRYTSVKTYYDFDSSENTVTRELNPVPPTTGIFFILLFIKLNLLFYIHSFEFKKIKLICNS